MEIKEFRIRCSGIGQIMTNTRAKTELLSQTTKTYCSNWLKGQIFNREKHFDSKYTQKGNEVEDNSLDFVAKRLGFGMILKNDKYFESDFMHGTPDAIIPVYVIDVKNSWDWSTFPLLEKEIPNQDYWWQLQGYMHLTGRKKAKLIYTLLDTPEHLIESEAKVYCFKNGYVLDNEIYEMFHNRMTYSDISDELKIKIFEIDYNENAIIEIENRVLLCRDYIAELLTTHPEIKKATANINRD
jgi:hypothetical protein